MKYTLYNSNRIAVGELTGSSLWENGKNYDYTYCLPQGVYTAKREDIGSRSSGWGNSFITMFVQDIQIGNWTLMEGVASASDTIYCIFI